MRRLIVNADDLGADASRDAGIFEAIRAGVVTSASILANGPSLGNSLRKILSLPPDKISWGIHLNLSEGTPLTEGLRRLCGKDGRFLGKAPAHELLSRRGDAELEKEIALEMGAQISSLQNSGILLSHLDGHQHIHVFPAVIRAALGAAEFHKIPWMRIPEEPDPSPGEEEVSGLSMAEARNFSRLAREARIHLQGTDIRTTDHFLGLYLKGRLTPGILKEILRRIPPGLTEFMVHPGRVPSPPAAGAFSSFSTPEREKELEALLDAGFRLFLRENGVEMTPFPKTGECPPSCAS